MVLCSLLLGSLEYQHIIINTNMQCSTATAVFNVFNYLVLLHYLHLLLLLCQDDNNMHDNKYYFIPHWYRSISVSLNVSVYIFVLPMQKCISCTLNSMGRHIAASPLGVAAWKMPVHAYINFMVVL